MLIQFNRCPWFSFTLHVYCDGQLLKLDDMLLIGCVCVCVRL